MDLSDIQFVFNRAWQNTFQRKKLLVVFAVLALCGLLVLFFRGIALAAGTWMTMSLTFMPVFLSAGVLLSTGIVLIRVYHDEVKNKDISYTNTLLKSIELILGAAYFSLPVIMGYLLLWVVLGLFVILKELPGVGEFFGIILAFGPFLLNLCTLVLCLLSVAMLFLITPIIALKGLNRMVVSKTLFQRMQKDYFSNILLGLIAILPAICIFLLLLASAFLTGSICYHCEEPLHNLLQSFFIMIPFSAFLAPTVVFFFNFAAESHVLMAKESRE